MAYANGRLPNSVLATIAGTTRRARADVVPQINAMRQAFAAHFGKPLVVTDGYRDYNEQVRLKQQLGFLAGTPGTSNHGWGLALDLGSGVNTFGSAEHNWMKANARRFGFYHPTWAQIGGSKPEAWHWETAGAVPVGNYTNIPGVDVPNPAVTPPTPIDPREDDEDMAKIIQRGDEPGMYLSAPALGVHWHIVDQERLGELQDYYGAPVKLNARQFDVRRQEALAIREQQGQAIGNYVVSTSVGDTGTLAQTTRNTEVMTRRTEEPVARILAAVIAPFKIRHWWRSRFDTEADQKFVDTRTAQIWDKTKTLDSVQAEIANTPTA